MRDTVSRLKNKTIWSLPRYINSVKWAGFFLAEEKRKFRITRVQEMPAQLP